MLGHLEGEAQEAVERAISWVGANAGRLKSWGGGSRTGSEGGAGGAGCGMSGERSWRWEAQHAVHSASEDVEVRVSEIDAHKKHGLSLSQGSCHERCDNLALAESFLPA